MTSRVSLSVLNRQHWERPGDPERLGCTACFDRQVCGGIRPGVDVFSCRDYCCGNPEACSRICDRKPAEFIERQREINGWLLDNIPRFEERKSSNLPSVLPELYHSSRRIDLLHTKAVAVPLSAIVGRNAARCAYLSKAALFDRLRVAPRAALVIDCIGRDRLIENFWANRRVANLIRDLARLRPAWVIVPNYSIITDVPRWENLHAMKRIAIVWAELMDEGLPAVLTLNARTDRDWERWTEFALARPELHAVAVELGTGARYADRRAFMLPRLRALGLATNGRLRLFMRGGRSHRPLVADAFSSVHLIDTNSFMKAVHRQHVVSEVGRLSSKRTWTLAGQPIEHILQGNVQASL